MNWGCRALAGAAVVLGIAAPAAAQAQQGDKLYPTLTVASEYRYDGVSNSSGNPVAQASLYWWRPDHAFAGVFVSSVDMSGFRDRDTSYEVDLYAGRNWDFGAPYFEMGGDATRLSLQAMYTIFPDKKIAGPTYDFLQLKAEAKHRIGAVTLRGETAYVPQASYGSGFAWKFEAGAQVRATKWLSVSGEYGYRDSQRRADRSWWDVGATASLGHFSLDLRYYDTSLDYVSCGYSPNCGSAVVGSLSWNISLG